MKTIRPVASPFSRRLAGVLGLSLLLIAGWAISQPGIEIDLKALLGALLFAALGIEEIVHAARGRASWLQRLGPLP